MKEIEELSIQLQRKKIILEVREGNNSAITLYKKLGYKIDGIRRNYYKEYKENAVLMSKKLP